MRTDGMLIGRRSLLLGAGSLGLLTLAGHTPAIAADPEPDIDPLVAKFMAAFEIPGAAVAIIRRGQEAYVRGYGVRALDDPRPVDRDTLFAIASNTKPFTAAALAILVDRRRIGWDDPVIKHLPDFQMHDPVATRMMTVRDLLLHRSGLPLGAGDLMLLPASDRTPEEVLHGLRHLKPARSFRSGFDYDNIFYTIAGLLVSRVSGRDWEDFVEGELLRPIGMLGAVASPQRVTSTNIAARHARLGPPVRGAGPVKVTKGSEGRALAPSGGLHSSASDIAKWLSVQLAGGKLPGGRTLWSSAQAEEMWKPQIIMSTSTGPTEQNPTRPVLTAYALGWMVSDYRGRRMIAHSGGLTGQVSWTAMLPEQGIGLAVLLSSEDALAATVLRNALLDQLIDQRGTDWLSVGNAYAEQGRKQLAEAAAAGALAPPPGGPSLPLAAYAGRYRDPWYGDVLIHQRSGALAIEFTRSPPFKGSLEVWGKDGFRTRFNDGVSEDALLNFVVEGGKVSAIRMKALSPLADFSYDYHDLDLRKVAER